MPRGISVFAVLTFSLLSEHTLVLFCLFKNVLPWMSSSKNFLLYIAFPDFNSRIDHFFWHVLQGTFNSKHLRLCNVLCLCLSLTLNCQPRQERDNFNDLFISQAPYSVSIQLVGFYKVLNHFKLNHFKLNQYVISTYSYNKE